MTDLRVGVIGAAGRMGSMTCQAVSDAPDMALAATVGHGDPLAEIVDAACDVVVDFTRPEIVMDTIEYAVTGGVHVVVGTSGFDTERLDRLTELCAAHPDIAVIVVPNFGIGAVLAMRFAREAARYFDSAEIIELHHAGKLDAPSGTALATAREIAAARRELPPAPDATVDATPGARGAVIDGIHVHSVRLPGLVAHMEVLLGGTGETLTIRQDSLSRESFMPGVLTAVRAAPTRPGLTVGLDVLL